MREYKSKMRGAKISVNFHSKLLAKDKWAKKLEHKKEFDEGTFYKGYEWFNNGLSLDEAPDDMKNNFNFVNGFEKARRIKNINENLEMLGTEWFESGLSLDNAPVSYINNPYFIEGYNKAKNNSSGKNL